MISIAARLLRDEMTTGPQPWPAPGADAEAVPAAAAAGPAHRPAASLR